MSLSLQSPGNCPVFLIVGPTGSGKSEVAVEVARRLSGEVISVDSRQVYQGLNVGTAKPEGKWQSTPQGRRYVVQGIIHHLVDHVSPEEPYTAGRFTHEATAVLSELAGRKTPVVMVGGTGLYFRSLVRGLAPLPAGNPLLRKQFADRAEREGRESLHRELTLVDPTAALVIPPNNIQRVIRALEVHSITGRPLSELQKEGTHPSPWHYRWFGLRWDPNVYQERLKERCLGMEEGILAETRTLLSLGIPPSAPAFQSLGYREAMAQFKETLSREEFSRDFLKETRSYAKRQATWFRGEPAVRWLDIHTPFSAAKIAELLLSDNQINPN